MPNETAISGPHSVGALVDRAFRLYRAHWAPLLLTGAMFLVPFGLLNGLISGSYSVDAFRVLGQLFTDPGRATELNQQLAASRPPAPLLLLQYVMLLLSDGLSRLALAAFCVDTLLGRPTSVIGAVRTALRRLGAYFGMLFSGGCLVLTVCTMAIVPAFGVMFGFFLLAAGLGQLQSGDFSTLMALAVGMLFLVGFLLGMAVVFGPLVYLMSRWIAALTGMLHRGWGPIEALRNSWGLTRGLVWRTVAFYLVVTALLYVVEFTLGILTFLPALLLPAAVSGVALGATSAAVQVILRPIGAAAVALYYFDLLVRKESFDLALRVEQLEAALPPTVSGEDLPLAG